MTDSIFGPLVGHPQVEAAVLSTLRTWLPTYLWEVERQNGLRRGTIPHPPTPESYRGGLDLLDWQQDECPTVIAVVNPTDATERSGSVGYSQWFDIQLGGIVLSHAEDAARLIAGHYGNALQGLMLQQGSLGGVASRTVMTSAPRVEFQDVDERPEIQVSAVFEALVAPIVESQSGPAVPEPPDSPQYGGTPGAPFGDWPTVETTTATVTADPITQE